MPADVLYWNSVDFDSDESIQNTIPRHYVDPWDLENYAYIREHLDSLDVSSEQSSYGEAIEANSSFYYTPGKPKRSSPDKKTIPPYVESEYGTAKYAEIEDVYGVQPRKNRRPRSIAPKKTEPENVYGIVNFGTESDEEENLYTTKANRRTSTALYDTRNRRPKVTVRRRMSYSYGDYGYKDYNTPSTDYYQKLEGSLQSESDRPTPIYDDVNPNKFRRNNFGLNNYGLLQIDYSCSWNNLDKYIYN